MIERDDLALAGLTKLTPKVHYDKRGFFYETLRKEHLIKVGITCEFVQENHSFSYKNVLRGMHWQSGQAKLIQVIVGTIFDVAVDIRPSSATFGQWVGIYLSEEKPHLLFIPDGFAHGFCVTSPIAHVIYKVSEYYEAKKERQFSSLDPEIAIRWPLSHTILSSRDLKAPSFQESICGFGL